MRLSGVRFSHYACALGNAFFKFKDASRSEITYMIEILKSPSRYVCAVQNAFFKFKSAKIPIRVSRD